MGELSMIKIEDKSGEIEDKSFVYPTDSCVQCCGKNNLTGCEPV